MLRAMAAEEHIIADLAVATDHGVVGEDDVVADIAIVRDMRADHQEAAIADRRDPSSADSAGIDRDALADLAVRADDKPRRLALVVHRLRRRAERGEGIDRGARPDRRVTRAMHA